MRYAYTSTYVDKFIPSTLKLVLKLSTSSVAIVYMYIWHSVWQLETTTRYISSSISSGLRPHTKRKNRSGHETSTKRRAKRSFIIVCSAEKHTVDHEALKSRERTGAMLKYI